MVMTIISTIFGDSNPRTIVTSRGAKFSGKKNTFATPNPNGNIIEVQTNAPENMLINISDIRITGDTSVLTIEEIYSMYKHRYTGTNTIILSVPYGSKFINGIGNLGTTISVILESFSIDVAYSDSANAYQPIASLVFRETS